MCRSPLSVPDLSSIWGISWTATKRENGYDDGVSVAPLMLKLAKRMEKIMKSIGVDRIAYLFSVGGFLFILEFLLDFWKDNPVMSTIESLIPY